MLKVLESDFARLPELLGRELVPAIPEPAAPPVLTVVERAPSVQLGLF
jgi:hypothetical protein